MICFACLSQSGSARPLFAPHVRLSSLASGGSRPHTTRLFESSTRYIVHIFCDRHFNGIVSLAFPLVSPFANYFVFCRYIGKPMI